MPWHTQAHDDAVDTLGIFEFQLMFQKDDVFDIVFLVDD